MLFCCWLACRKSSGSDVGSSDAWGLGRAVAIDEVQVRLGAPTPASSTVTNAAGNRAAAEPSKYPIRTPSLDRIRVPPLI